MLVRPFELHEVSLVTNVEENRLRNNIQFLYKVKEVNRCREDKVICNLKELSDTTILSFSFVDFDNTLKTFWDTKDFFLNNKII